jgi:hypothetical protein
MSTTKRRQRRAREQQTAIPGAAQTATPGPAATPKPPVPEFKWKTFPVYFAFWLGALIFLELGIIAGATGNSAFTTVISAVVALFLGFGVARLAVNWMMRHNWVKPRPKR